MAERTSTRTASRRTTPQPAVAPFRTKRTTRSQSRDISDSDGAANGMRMHTKRTRAFAEDVDVPIDRSNPKRLKGRPANHSRNVQDLSTVLETDPRNIGDGEERQTTENGGSNEQIKTPSKSPGAVSAFSGTTARNSLSEVQSTKADQSANNQADNIDGKRQKSLDADLPSKLSKATHEPEDKRKAKKAPPLHLAQFNSNSKKAKDAAAFLKRTETNRKEALAAEQSSLQQGQYPTPEIQVTATATPSTQESSAQRQIEAQDILPPASPKSVVEQTIKSQQDDFWRPQIEDQDGPIIPDISQLREIGRRCHSLHAQIQAESNKENLGVPNSQTESPSRHGPKLSLLDTQQGAERVSWEDFPEHSQRSRISQVSDAEDFQEQAPAADATARRALKPTGIHPPSQPTRHQGLPREVNLSQEPSRSSRLDVIPSRTIYQPTPSPILADYKEANSVAKTRKTYVQNRQQTQIRKPWSDEETEQLLTLIEEHGISWTTLLKIDQDNGNILQARGQVALKDKARNMKVDFLKASRRLPTNFDLIAINKLQIDRLIAEGIEYDRETGMRVDAEIDDVELDQG